MTVPDVVPDDDRLQLVCIRPPGAFKAFDDRVTLIATRLVKRVRVTILRAWEAGTQADWLGFVSATVPTVLVLRAGQIVAKCVGDVPHSEIDALLSGAPA
jgi:hypothetical protein